MRACVIRSTGGLDRIEIADVAAPGSPTLLGGRDVRVAIRAVALNHLDLFVVRGLPGEYQFPHILGSDGAGVVETAGPDVTTVKPGDAVMINPGDRKSTRLNSSHEWISYAVFCLKKKNK